MTISPLEGFSSPASIFKSVDFPEPLVPTIEQKLPPRIPKETPLRARTFELPDPVDPIQFLYFDDYFS
jgi:hypothetical protein